MSYNLSSFLEQLKKYTKGWMLADISIIQKDCGDISSDICEVTFSNDKDTIRRFLICNNNGNLSIENITDQSVGGRIVFLSLSHMLDTINEHLRNNCDKAYIQDSLYGINQAPYIKFGSIILLEDVKKLQLGFGFQSDKNGTEWWTTLSAIKASNHPWKKFFANRDGRRIIADHLCRNWVTDLEYYKSMETEEHA